MPERKQNAAAPHPGSVPHLTDAHIFSKSRRDMVLLAEHLLNRAHKLGQAQPIRRRDRFQIPKENIVEVEFSRRIRDPDAAARMRRFVSGAQTFLSAMDPREVVPELHHRTR